MSIGPQKDAELYGTTRFDKVRYSLKKAGEVYFERPFHYLFYTALFGVVVSLLLHSRPPLEIYIILSILFIIDSVQKKPLLVEPKPKKKKL